MCKERFFGAMHELILIYVNWAINTQTYEGIFGNSVDFLYTSPWLK